MREHIELDEAKTLLATLPARPQRETVSLSDASGRVLAEDCSAQLSIPPFDKSPFDGYACRSEDTPGIFRVVGVAAAGCGELPPLGYGEAMRIFTGAPLPPGADTIIRQEDATAEDAHVELPCISVSGQNVIREGEDVRYGQMLVEKGTLLEPGHLGLLASQGIGQVSVFCRPRAVLIPTGTELFEPGQARSPFGIYNSSSYALTAYMERIGLLVLRKDIVPDDAQTVYTTVRSALESDAQVVFTTGGASVGDCDFAAQTSKQLDAESLFWKVNMKPGGALMVSVWQDKLLVNLSGNPAAAVMSLLIILRPWLEKLCGMSAQESELELPVLLPMPKTCSVTRLLRGHLLIENGRAWFVEHQGRGNGNLGSFVGCDLIGYVPGGSKPLKTGDIIRALHLPSNISSPCFPRMP